MSLLSASAGKVRIALVSPPYAVLSYVLPDYLSAEAFAPGQRVAVPLGKGLRAGVLLGAEENAPEESGDFTLKPVLWPLEKKPLLSARYLDLAVTLGKRQGEPLGRILGSLLPQGLRTTQIRLRFFGDARPKEMRLKELRALPEDELLRLGELWMRGRTEVCRSDRSPLDAEVCVLAADPPWPVRPAAKAQTALLEYLFERGLVTRRRLLDDLGRGAGAVLSTLAGRGLVRIRPAEEDSPDEALSPVPIVPPGGAPVDGAENAAAFTLTRQQRDAFEPLLESALSRKAETRLLFGITGSGKTAVYLELARAVLASGRSVLLLAPEVALALKLKNDADAALPLTFLPAGRRHLFHGYQGQAARERLFRLLAEEAGEGAPRLVAGTRSALLLPLENIGLIILDEEHDASFKQDEGFVYQAKEVAWYRAIQENALLLMGSATPDLKSFHAAREGRIPLHALMERVGGGSLPGVEIVPLPKSQGTDSLLAPQSLEALAEVSARGEQAVILLNRRGYAPLMYCLACDSVVRCPHCDIALAYHKARERLICHYCGFSLPYPAPCPACNALHFLPMGEGTEKLEEGLAAHLPPGAGVLRLDRDSARRTGRMEAILAAFARKEAAVLVGTQMLSKGHHFPDVTLVVVADADLGLNLPDYRAAERTFQLLLQSAGRAGRGEKPGRVLIQTRDPGHYCWDFVRRADYEGFFERELELRRRRRYPPFVRLALIRISHAFDDAAGPEAVAALGAVLRRKAKESGVIALGPAPAPLALLKGRRRWHCLLKGENWQVLRQLYRAACEASGAGALRLRLDLDPVNML